MTRQAGWLVALTACGTGVIENGARQAGACVDSSDCDPSERCVPVGDTGTLLARCAPVAGDLPLGETCDADGECAGGVCHLGRCTALCGGICFIGARCEAAEMQRGEASGELAVCRFWLAPPAQELGGLVLDGGAVESFEVPIPAALASFTLVLLDADGDAEHRAGFASLTAPDGSLLLARDDGIADPNPATDPFPGAVSVQVPSGDSLPGLPQAGVYDVEAGLYTTSDYILYTPVAGTIERTLVVVEPAGEEGGSLDLNLFIAAGVAADAAFIDAMLERVAAIWRAEASVALGDVELFALDAAYDQIPDVERFHELAAEQSLPGPHGVSVNAFVVVDIGFAGGFAGGAPGPPGIFGAPASGLMLEALGDGAATGVLLAHEIGHFLGLEHTTKLAYDAAQGAYVIRGHDAISDSPQCSAGRIEDCPDYRNLMFPLFPLEVLALSPAQARIARGSPTLYEIPSERCDAAATYDITRSRFATGDTARLRSALSGSCGGGLAPERAQLYTLRADVAQLRLRVVGEDFAPVVYVRAGACEGAEVACGSAAAGQPVELVLAAPVRGDYFVVVDARAGGGTFVLEVEEVP